LRQEGSSLFCLFDSWRLEAVWFFLGLSLGYRALSPEGERPEPGDNQAAGAAFCRRRDGRGKNPCQEALRTGADFARLRAPMPAKLEACLSLWIDFSLGWRYVKREPRLLRQQEPGLARRGERPRARLPPRSYSFTTSYQFAPDTRSTAIQP